MPVWRIMNIYNRSLLVGMSLGDGCIKQPHNELVIQHSGKQLEYLDFKRHKLHSIFGGKLPNIHKENHYLKSNNKHYVGYRIGKANKYFRLLYKLLYINGKKTFTKRVLNYLTPEAISYWYMDDGGISKNINNGKISSVECRLYTYCSEEEANIILEYFKNTHNIIGKKRLYRLNNSWIIVFNTKQSIIFENLIRKYIISSMQYKLPNYHCPRTPDILI